MLKRLFVSSSSLLKSKGRRYYWVPPNPEELSKISLIKQKYDIPAEVIHLIESHEKELKNINDQLTKQIKVIEKIHDTTNDNYNYIDKIDTIQKFTLFLTFVSYINLKVLTFIH
jgi:hypothetical protein